MGTMTSYNPFEAMKLDDRHCFLCGAGLKGTRTKEHVFPQWLLRRHGLTAQKLTLLNDTHIRYGQLVVPCCADCNTAWLSSLEGVMQRAFETGPDLVRSMPGQVFQWMLKIFYGLLIREMSLAVDRATSQPDVIMPPEHVEAYRMAHVFLQSVRQHFEFVGRPPFSLLILPLHVYGDERDFDYIDSPAAGVFALRSGEVGIILVLEDCASQQPGFSELEGKVAGHHLLDIQFYQLFAMVRYRASLMQRVPRYTALHDEGSDTVTVTCHPLEQPIYREWVQAEYAVHLAQVLGRRFPGVALDDIFVPPDGVREFTFTEQGDFASMGPRESPFRLEG